MYEGSLTDVRVGILVPPHRRARRDSGALISPLRGPEARKSVRD